MIGALKARAKRHWPRLRLRTILLLTLVLVASLPGFGALFLRVYENTLVRQTEAELVAQGAALAATAAASWPGTTDRDGAPLRQSDYRAEPTTIDLRSSPVLPERPDPVSMRGSPDPAEAAVAGGMSRIFRDTARTTLAAIRLIDRRGRILTGPDADRGYARLPELDAALAGTPATRLRHNGAYRSRYPLEWLSRASDLRIHHARPIVVNGTVVGAILLSRSPRALFRGLYEDRGKIVFGIVAIFALLVALAGLLSRGIARPIERLSRATRAVATGQGDVPAIPETAAIEIQALYRDFAAMAAAIDRRSHYLRDFAHAVSHEFKTPLAGIRGAIELLQDHFGTMSEADRARFLANAADDAGRLAILVTRLLDLARADMAERSAGTSDIGAVLHRLADALRSDGLRIDIDGLAGPIHVAVAAETLEPVFVNLIENARQADATRIAFTLRSDASRVVVTAADDGHGIPAGDAGRIFEPFFTSRRAVGGTGLGLPISRSLLHAAGGTIRLETAAKGARFVVTLPVAA